jgi:hypothetical protein
LLAFACFCSKAWSSKVWKAILGSNSGKQFWAAILGSNLGSNSGSVIGIVIVVVIVDTDSR